MTGFPLSFCAVLYEIVAGERCRRAAKNVFGDAYEMPVVIRALNDTDAEALALTGW